VNKRQSHGIAWGGQYTLSKSMDDTTATSGNPSLPQDDTNLAAEWARSNFDRRHQFSGNASVQLPWGKDRHWLSDGGFLSTIVGDWSLNGTLTWNSGTPLTIRCSLCAAALAGGIVGTLRADYNGQAIAIPNPTINQFFNTAAFTPPVAGTFGNSGRNIVTGPGSHLLNASLSRDVRLGGQRSMTMSATFSNLLNTVNYGAINTDVNNLAQFGEVTSVGSMRSARLNFRFRF
jgi:hypothetical protein